MGWKLISASQVEASVHEACSKQECGLIAEVGREIDEAVDILELGFAHFANHVEDFGTFS